MAGDASACIPGNGIEATGGVEIVERRLHIMAEDVLLFPGEDPAENDHRLLNPITAQIQPFPDQGNAELVGTCRGKGRSHSRSPMAVGIGLDHGEDLAFRADTGPDLLQIEAQGVKVDFNPGWARKRWRCHDGMATSRQKMTGGI
jgi:hypothetical protein